MSLSNPVVFMVFILLTTLVPHLKTMPSQEDLPNKASVTPNTHPTTRKPKFGFAWLFSNSGSENESDAPTSKKPKKEVDKRIEATNLELEGSIGESRITVFSSNVKLWNVGLNKKLCSSKDMIDWDGMNRLDAEEGDTIVLKCMLHDVHHEVDFDNFQASWTVSKHRKDHKTTSKRESSSNSEAMTDGIESNEIQACSETRIETEKDPQNNFSQVVGNHLLSGDRPSCKLFTEFPFEDLTTVTKDITCTTEMIISPATINDTGIYTCRSKIGFKSIGDIRQNITFDDATNKAEGLYELSGSLMIKVVRKRGEDDYRTHRIVSMIVGAGLCILIIGLMGKKLSQKRLGWESKTENYAPEWTRGVPVRRIASAGSLASCKSQTKLSESRRSSLVEIQEESEEESSNTENSKDNQGSRGFDLNNTCKEPYVRAYDDNDSQNPLSYPKQSDRTDTLTCKSYQPEDGDIKRVTKPKSILKTSRRGSTP